MQRKIEFIAKDAESAMQEAVNKLHIPSDKIYINVLGELPEGLNCEALVDVNLTLEGKKYLENILKTLNIGYQIEARSIGNEQQIHYMIDSYENSLLIGVKGITFISLLPSFTYNLYSQLSITLYSDVVYFFLKLRWIFLISPFNISSLSSIPLK